GLKGHELRRVLSELRRESPVVGEALSAMFHPVSAGLGLLLIEFAAFKKEWEITKEALKPPEGWGDMAEIIQAQTQALNEAARLAYDRPKNSRAPSKRRTNARPTRNNISTRSRKILRRPKIPAPCEHWPKSPPQADWPGCARNAPKHCAKNCRQPKAPPRRPR